MSNPIVTIEMESGDVMKAELYPEIAPPELDFDLAVFEIQRQRDQGNAVLHDPCVELDDLTLVHQKSPCTDRVAVENIALLIRRDMHTAHKKLTVFDGAERILQIDVAGADGLDLGACKLNTGFKALQNKILMESFSVGGYFLFSKLLWQVRSHILSERILPQTERK